MSRGSLTLWIISAVMVAITAAALLFWPSPEQDRQEQSEAIATTVAKAKTYFDFEHYDRAAETFAAAAEDGMSDGIAWYQYARSVELSTGLDLGKYLTAFELLLAQYPTHEYLEQTEALLTDSATPFVYQDAVAGQYRSGELVVAEGTVVEITWGRIESGRDRVRIDTRPNRWMTHLGDPVVVDIPRTRRYQAGDTITVIGRFEGVCGVDDGAGLSREYPCIVAAGSRLVGP